MLEIQDIYRNVDKYEVIRLFKYSLQMFKFENLQNWQNKFLFKKVC